MKQTIKCHISESEYLIWIFGMVADASSVFGSENTSHTVERMQTWNSLRLLTWKLSSYRGQICQKPKEHLVPNIYGWCGDLLAEEEKNNNRAPSVWYLQQTMIFLLVYHQTDNCQEMISPRLWKPSPRLNHDNRMTPVIVQLCCF